MEKKYPRSARTASLIKEQVANILHEEFDFGLGVIFTVLEVNVSRDNLHAEVVISIIPNRMAQEVMLNLTGRVYDIQQDLNRKLVMRPVPKLRFTLHGLSRELDAIDQAIKQSRLDVKRIKSIARPSKKNIK